MDNRQRARWKLEKAALKRYCPAFAFRGASDGARVMGWVKTAGGSRYKLRLDIPAQFPCAPPELCVVKPRVLWTHGRRKRLNDMGCSARFHTNGPGSDGVIRVCYYHHWDATWTWLRIIALGTLWCEAYAAHLRTGEDLAGFLPAARR